MSIFDLDTFAIGRIFDHCNGLDYLNFRATCRGVYALCARTRAREFFARAIARDCMPDLVYFLQRWKQTGMSDLEVGEMIAIGVRDGHQMVECAIEMHAPELCYFGCIHGNYVGYSLKAPMLYRIRFAISEGRYELGRILMGTLFRSAVMRTREGLDFYISEHGYGDSRVLYYAAKQRNLSVVEKCLAIGANIEEMLLGAARGGHEDLCKRARERGAVNLNLAMRKAARGGHDHICRYLVSQGETMQWVGRPLGHSGNLELCMRAIDSGVPPSEIAAGAVLKGSIEIVRHCIDHGAENYGELLELAAGHGNVAMCEYLCDIAPASAIHLNVALCNGANAGSVDVCRAMVLRGARDVESALLSAVHANSLPVCRFLRERGARNFNQMIRAAVMCGHAPLCVLAYLWGARDFACVYWDTAPYVAETCAELRAGRIPEWARDLKP